MNNYTADTRQWLDKRFKMTDDEGVYLAHEPIYGFKAGPSEPHPINRLVRTYAILRHLNQLEFSSCLDVGGAEGYHSCLVRTLRSVPAYTSDLSFEANLRARQIYGLQGLVFDAHSIPFADDSLDLVLCSECIEHTVNPEDVVAELVRIARRYVLITTGRARTDESARAAVAGCNWQYHRHLHCFTKSRLQKTTPQNTTFAGTNCWPRFQTFMVHLEGGNKLPDSIRSIKDVFKVCYYSACNFLGRRIGLCTVRFLILLDYYLSRWFSDLTTHHLILIDCRSNGASLQKKRPARRVNLLDFLLSSKVPKFYLDHHGSEQS